VTEKRTPLDVYFHHNLIGMHVYLWVPDCNRWLLICMQSMGAMHEKIAEKRWLDIARSNDFDVMVHQRDHIYCVNAGIEPEPPKKSATTPASA
jgi:hypothetical protein